MTIGGFLFSHIIFFEIISGHETDFPPATGAWSYLDCLTCTPEKKCQVRPREAIGWGHRIHFQGSETLNRC